VRMWTVRPHGEDRVEELVSLDPLNKSGDVTSLSWHVYPFISS
jgi:hypothetical protein